MAVATSLSDISKLKESAPEHFVIIYGKETHIPGDARALATGGAHGYPESTEHSVYMVTYPDRAEWEAAITKETTSKFPKDFMPAILRFPKINIATSVQIMD